MRHPATGLPAPRPLLAPPLALCLAWAAGASATPMLHVPSPDWRDQIVYFALIDRFDDGDPSNNDQGAGEYDPADHRKYSGGDLRGLARRVDYVRDLGATALWITPPVANQWWDGALGYGGYHGYWAEHFMQVDAHYGTLDDYRALSHALHASGMYLIQDVVVNHTGNFFSYRDGWERADPTRHYAPNPDARPVPAPTQWPFSLNDARDPAHRAAGVYHWTPPITDFAEREQELSFALADLDDLATGNRLVRRALRESYGYWIREVGVDAFRVDTAYHVEPDFFHDFMHADDAEHPGMIEVARQTGRTGFIAFGEGFGVDRAYDDANARKLESYVRDADGRPLLSSMINFPLYGSALAVFARGRPPAELAHRIDSMMRVHADPHRMPSFIDNHDVDRFLAGGSEAGLKQGLLMLMTLPGIPTIYYGTEQGFTEPRRAMFAGGHAAGGRDHFDTDAPLYRYLQRATALRRAHRVFSRGTPTVLAANAAAAGALAWRMDHAGDTTLVVFNSADADTLLANLATGLPAGTRLAPLFAIDGEAAPRVVGVDGRLTLRLPPRAGLVWRVDGRCDIPPPSAARLTLDPLPAYPPAPPVAGKKLKPLSPRERARDEGAAKPRTPPTASTEPPLRTSPGTSARAPSAHTAPDDGDATPVIATDLSVAGSATGLDRFHLVVDGDLANAQIVRPDRHGRWRATVATASMIDPAIEHSLVAWSGQPAAVSAIRRFRVQRAWTVVADIEDPAGDDTGPRGEYRYPTDPSWGDARQLDLRGARAATSGGSLRLDLRMHRLTASWNPPHGFDHVVFTVFIELPDRDGGASVMPLQNAELPAGMRWHYRLRIGGWSNALFAAEGASAEHEGSPVAAGARIDIDRDADTLRLTLPAAALGHPPTLAGARIHITTWDYDGRYRPLHREPGPHTFGGGDGNRDPLVMDDLRLVIPRQ